MVETMSPGAYWDERYRTDNAPWNTAQPSTELMRVVAEDGIEPCTAIDLGCGLGVHSIWLSQQHFDVTGVDVSPLVIDRARKRALAEGARVRFLVADVLHDRDVGGPYDFFFDRGCYHYVRNVDVRGYLDCLQRVTQPGSLGLVLAGNEIGRASCRERV